MSDTKAPRIYGPRDVPRLRAHLVKLWQSDRMRYPTTEVVQAPDGVVRERTVLDACGPWERLILRQPSYWYVGAPMCEVLAAAERQLPHETILEPELIPQPTGLVVFEQPMLGIDAESGARTMHVDAILWGPGEMPPAPGFEPGFRTALGIASYQRLRLQDGMRREEMHAMQVTGALEAVVDKMYAAGKPAADNRDWDELVGDIWLPLGRSDWVVGEPLSHRHGPMTDDAFGSMVEDRQRLASMWLLIAQEGIADTVVDHGTRQERRRAERVGEPVPTVRVVSIKAKARADSGESTETEERRHLTVRFLVSGHWRRQYYRSDGSRRPIWIHAHWRGPEDGPISDVTKVRVWK